MKEMNLIDPSQTEWADPIFFVSKKDGYLLFFVEYRRVNTVTLLDSYPIPRMEECIDSVGEAKVFSTLDTNAGYWQIEIDDAEKEKTFTSHHFLYQFTRIPFGLNNSPDSIQRVIDVILASFKWQFALV